jgi:predicted ABC-type exoprotein transport system permease subunit
VFKHPTTRLVPKALRHTWFAGLGRTTAIILFCTPMFLASMWAAAFTVFTVLMVTFRKESWMLIIDDLENHRKDKRGIFQHSKDCYMVGGKTATFMRKYLERNKTNPFED